MKDKKRVLLGSPIRQKPIILRHFLKFLEYLKKDSLILDYYFIDDNVDVKSKKLLKKFKEKYPNTLIREFNEAEKYEYICNEESHYWTPKLIKKVGKFKDEIIEYARKNEYDYVFLVDSDLLLQPQTILHLVSTKKDIISEVFWTKWQKDLPYLPQVWLSDEYNFYEAEYGKADEKTKQLRAKVFLRNLRKKGIYKVGGLGACTLISKRAMEKGVSFKPIYNVSMIGEDRHFCIRAAALGFELYASTYYPPLHLYREEDLKKIGKFKRYVLSKI